MKTKFKAKAIFKETNKIIDKRISCNIFSELNKNENYDIIFILLNPGSSMPIDGKTVDNYTEIKLDPTMLQLIEIMKSKNFENALLINLSTYKEPKKVKFEKMINNGKLLNTFLDINNNNFTKTTVVFAWGVLQSQILITLAKTIFEHLTKLEMKIVAYTKNGMINEDTISSCYHPLIRKTKTNQHHCKNNWVEEIVRQINEIN